jgi:transcription initiation factor TFIID TATA-box-binding protein
LFFFLLPRTSNNNKKKKKSLPTKTKMNKERTASHSEHDFGHFQMDDVKIYTEDKSTEDILRDFLGDDPVPMYNPGDLMPVDGKIKCEPLPECTIANVVSTYKLGVVLNLKKMALCLKPVLQPQYNPLNFAAMALNIRTKDLPPTMALIFSTSNVVHTGAKSEDHSRMMAWALVYYLNKFLGIPAWVHDFFVRNIVCHFKVGFPVNVEDLAAELGSRATFIPRRIHSCRIRFLEDESRVCLMYPSGSGVLTGSKTRNEVIGPYKEMVRYCNRFRHTGVNSSSQYRYSRRMKNCEPEAIDGINRKLNTLVKKRKVKETATNTGIADSPEVKDTGSKRHGGIEVHNTTIPNQDSKKQRADATVQGDNVPEISNMLSKISVSDIMKSLSIPYTLVN